MNARAGTRPERALHLGPEFISTLVRVVRGPNRDLHTAAVLQGVIPL